MPKNDIKSWSSQHQEEFLKNAYLEIGDTYLIDTEKSNNFFQGRESIPEDIVKLCLDPNY